MSSWLRDHLATKERKMQKQRTFTVDGEKITIKSRPSHYCGNYNGWIVTINGEKFKIPALMQREEAVEKAYVKWVMAK